MSEGDAARVVLQPVGSVILVPLQGPVSAELFEELRACLLQELSKQGKRAIVLDLRGVEVMDAVDLDHLRRVVESARLMGAEVRVAEVQPGVAAGLALLDGDTSWVKATRTVKKAMESLEHISEPAGGRDALHEEHRAANQVRDTAPLRLASRPVGERRGRRAK